MLSPSGSSGLYIEDQRISHICIDRITVRICDRRKLILCQALSVCSKYKIINRLISFSERQIHLTRIFDQLSSQIEIFDRNVFNLLKSKAVCPRP